MCSCKCTGFPLPSGQLRGIGVPHHWRARRPLFFSHPLPSFTPSSPLSASSFTTSQLSPFSLIQRRGYASVMQLEDRANSETDNPQAQSRYLTVRMTNTQCTCTSIELTKVPPWSRTIVLLYSFMHVCACMPRSH